MSRNAYLPVLPVYPRADDVNPRMMERVTNKMFNLTILSFFSWIRACTKLGLFYTI